MIKLDGVRKCFGEKVAVKDISLEIKPGEFFVFLGPNGAGKTTTIKMIAGLLTPTSGKIFVGGFDISKEYVSHRRIMGYIPDEPFLYDKLSGREFLNFIASIYNLHGEIKKEIEKYVDIFLMANYIDELIESYSHGMKQRVAIASTLLHKPKVIVVDEPLVGLDPATQKLVLDIFKNEAKNGASILMSTHIISVAEENADRIGIINEGRMLAVKSMDEFKQLYGEAKLESIFFKVIQEKTSA